MEKIKDDISCGGFLVYYCSKCRNQFLFDKSMNKNSKYCSKCGKKLPKKVIKDGFWKKVK